MKKSKKIYLVVVIFLAILFLFSKVFASDIVKELEPVEYPEEFKRYLKLPEEEKKKVIAPRSFQVFYEERKIKNPLSLFKAVSNSLSANEEKFALWSVIPNNSIVKNQQDTDLCWAFTGTTALETKLALLNNDVKIYDFSERHIDYSRTRNFLNNQINPYGFNVEPGAAGNWIQFEAYLTNGMGPIDESEMPFQNKPQKIDISQIQNKTITAQVSDTIYFPNYKKGQDTSEVREKIKEHIKNNGALYCELSSEAIFNGYYNNRTAAYYCDDNEKYHQNREKLI